MLEPIDQKEANSQHQHPLIGNKQYIPIVFEVNNSSQNNSNFVSENNLNLITYSNSNNNTNNNVPLTTTDSIYNSQNNTPILVPTNYFNNNNSNNLNVMNSTTTTSQNLQNYSLDSTGVLKEGNFQNITFVINNATPSDLNTSNVIIASSLNGNNVGFNNSNTNFFDLNSNGKLNFQQTQTQSQLQLQQQKLKMTKSKKTSQLSNEIDEERTSQLVSEILKNIKEKTKELENLNQNLKTTGTNHLQASSASNDYQASNSNLSGKNLTNSSTKLSNYTNLSSNNPMSDVSNSSFISHDNEEKTMSQKTESNFYSSGELFEKFDLSNSTTANESFSMISNSKTAKLKKSTSQETRPKKGKQENKPKSIKNPLGNKRVVKHVVPLGWNRIIQVDISSNKIICYTSPSGVALYSIQDIKNYLLSDGTCKCGLECPLNVNDVFSFDVKTKHSNAKLNNSHKHKCAIFKDETDALKKLKKKLNASSSVSPGKTARTALTTTQLNTKKSQPLANENSDESFDESKISQLLLSGYLNSEDTSNSFDLNKSNSQLCNIFNLNHESNLEQKQNLFTFTNVNDRENNSVYQNQTTNTLTENFYNMKMNYQTNFESNSIFVNFNNSDKGKYFLIFRVQKSYFNLK